MQHKKRILLFNLAVDEDDPVLGFAVPFIARIARDAESVDVITVRTGRYRLPPNVTVRSVGREAGRGRISSVVAFYVCLFRELRQGRPDFCFSHMNPLFVAFAGPFLRIRGIPVILWYSHRKRSVIVRIAHFFAWRIITSAPRGYDSDAEKVVITGQMTDTDFFKPDAGIGKDLPPVFISVGRIAPIKDLMTFVRAAALMRTAGRPCKCVCIGPVLPHDAAYYALLREEVGRLSLGDIFFFSGSLPYRDMPAAYARASFHVNLCATGALDKAVLEAMACGVPGIFANAEFVPLYGSFGDALRFKYGDPEDLARVLTAAIVLTPAQSAAFGSALRAAVVREHSLESFMARFTALTA